MKWNAQLDRHSASWHISFFIYDRYEFVEVHDIFNDIMYRAQELGMVHPYYYTVHIEDEAIQNIDYVSTY